MFGEVLIVKVVVGKLFVRGMVDWEAAGDVNTGGVSAVEIPTHVLVEVGDRESGSGRNIRGW